GFAPPDLMGKCDLRARPRQPVAALDAALAPHEPCVAKVAEDVLEELERNLLGLRDALALDVDAVLDGGELDAGSQGVVSLRGNPHALQVTAFRHRLARSRWDSRSRRRIARPRRSAGRSAAP